MRETLRPGLSSLEWRLMRAFWASPAALSLSGLRLALDADWDIGSLEAVVARLVEKGYVESQPGSSIGRFSARLAKGEVIREEALRWCGERELDWSDVETMIEGLLDAKERHAAAGTAGRPA